MLLLVAPRSVWVAAVLINFLPPTNAHWRPLTPNNAQWGPFRAGSRHVGSHYVDGIKSWAISPSSWLSIRPRESGMIRIRLYFWLRGTAADEKWCAWIIGFSYIEPLSLTCHVDVVAISQPYSIWFWFASSVSDRFMGHVPRAYGWRDARKSNHWLHQFSVASSIFSSVNVWDVKMFFSSNRKLACSSTKRRIVVFRETVFKSHFIPEVAWFLCVHLEELFIKDRQNLQTASLYLLLTKMIFWRKNNICRISMGSNEWEILRVLRYWDQEWSF